MPLCPPGAAAGAVDMRQTSQKPTITETVKIPYSPNWDRFTLTLVLTNLECKIRIASARTVVEQHL